ncbi:MAG: hypothetical protein WAV90_22715 [Gordonia amarae]
MGFMGKENTPDTNYLEDTGTRFVRIELKDGRFTLIGQFFSPSEYEFSYRLDTDATRQFSQLLGLPLDDEFLAAVADRFQRSNSQIEEFLKDNEIPHTFWNRFEMPDSPW